MESPSQMVNHSPLLNIFLLNIRSLRHKTTELQLYIQELQLKSDIIFDVIALTETWVKNDEAQFLQIDGYKLVLQERTGQRGGGVAIYFKQELNFETFDVAATAFNAIKFKIIGNSGLQLTGLLIYRFPKSNRNIFYSELSTNLAELSENSLIMGDINIDLIKISDASEYINILTSFGYTSFMSEPTRVVTPYATCIDHVFHRQKQAQNSISVVSCTVRPNGLSDHHALVLQLNGLNRMSKSPPVNRKHYFKRTDWDALNSSFIAENWELLFSGRSVDGMFEAFVDKLKSSHSIHTKTIRKIPGKHKRNPWASPQLVRYCKQKNDLYLLVKKFPNNLYLRNQYKNISKKVHTQILADKKYYYGQLLDKAGLNSGKYWRLLNDTMGRTKKGIDRVYIDGISYDVAQNETFVANTFNQYFSGVTSNLAAGRAGYSDPLPTESYFQTVHNSTPGSFFMFPITPQEILDAIKSVSNKPSMGIDGIETSLIKNCSHSLVTPLEILFNSSIQQGLFPNLLKTAVVVPIFKTGSHTDIVNYRPISILSVISKIFELIIKNRIMTFFLNNNLFSDRQFGFLPGRSTDDALFSHVTDITNSTERGNMTVALYLDISKAFDTVDHDILIEKLYSWGIRGLVLDWFTTYLKGRSQVVRIGDNISSPLKITSGVPQGSTLGPILFLIYANELLNLKISGRIYSFADDTALLFTAKTKSELINKINVDLHSLSAWFWKHKLYANLEKTKIISYGYQYVNLHETLKLHIRPNCLKTCNCKYLKQFSETKYLGLILDQKLNWGPYTVHLQNRLRKLNFLLYHASKLLTRSHLLRLYRAMYDPVLRYGIIHWGHSPKKYTQPIKTLQKFGVRIIAGIRKRDSTVKYFREFCILNFDNIYKLYSAKYAHKHFNTFGVIEISSGLRDRGLLLIKPNWSKDSSRSQSAYSVPSIFNSLPLELREITYHKQFSKSVHKFLFNQTDCN